MQVVINISEEDYEGLKKKDEFNDMYLNHYEKLIVHCTPLPKGHGRLKDFDKIEWYGCTTDFDCPFRHLDCKDCERAECDKTQVNEIPTIIEADKSGEEK
jgi:hypothetical protein